MKRIDFTTSLILSLCFLGICPLKAQNQNPGIEFKINYVHTIPVGRAAVNINPGGGLAFETIYKPENSRFAYGMDLGMIEYGLHKEDVKYPIDAQNQIDAEMAVMNCQAFLNLIGRLNLTQSSQVKPYLQTKLGLNYFWTPLRIYDPESSNQDDCQNTLEKAILAKDILPSGSIGMGVSADLSFLFKSSCNRSGVLHLDVQANYTHGPSFRHMNVKNAYIPVNNPSTTKSGLNNSGKKQEVIHEYYQGNSYLSPLRMIDFRMGLSWLFN
ncbi:MAG: hypothetical protein NW226_08315 [Microscillaceae bacterium]|nr:hypothetical protein [Microscillaceae bacterium]